MIAVAKRCYRMQKFKLNNYYRNTWSNNAWCIKILSVAASFVMITVSFLSVLSSSCCLTKVVEGSDGLAGTYSLYTGAASFLPTCMSVTVGFTGTAR